MYENSGAGGPKDYALSEPDSTFDVAGVGVLNSTDFGNFIAGYAAGVTNDLIAFGVVHLFGTIFGITKPDASVWTFGDDPRGFGYINTGWWYGVNTLGAECSNTFFPFLGKAHWP